MSLCQYKNALGKPNEGIHFHVFGVAIIDFIFTIIGAYILSGLFNQSFIYFLIGLFLLGTFLHLLFCVDTNFTLLLKNIFCY